MSGERFRVPPHSVEAEQALLGGLLIANDAWPNVDGVLTAGDFYRHDHRLIFEAVATLAERGEPFDMVTVSERLKETGNSVDAGGLAYLGQLASETPSAANVRAYATTVRRLSARRDLVATHERLRNAAWETEGKSLEDILGSAESELLRIRDETATTTRGPRFIKDTLQHAVETIEERFECKHPIVGVPTGYQDLDELTTGLHPGNLVIIGARPGMGKTALATCIAEYVASKGKPVLFHSLEMSEDEITLRFISSMSRINLQKLRSGRLDDDDWPRLMSAVSMLQDAPLLIDDRPALTVAEIRATARRWQKTTGLGLVIIDQLNLMKGEGETQTIKVGALATGCKVIAKELKLPVILLAQLNRDLERRPDKRPNAADLRDSGEIEQISDLIWFLYRDEVYNEDSPDKGIAELNIAKQRNGPRGLVRLTWRGDYARFENYHPDVYGVGL